MPRPGSRTTAVPVALLGLLALSCGEGVEVDMGRLVSPGTAGAPALPPVEPCGARVCASFSGSRVFVEPSASDTLPERFDDGFEHTPSSDPEQEPALLYPSDETMLPVNASLTRFAWSPGSGAVFALDFVGERATVRIITRETSFSPSLEQWGWLAESNRGGRVELVIRALNPDLPSEIWRSRTIALHVSASAVDGTIYYWSTASRGLMRATLDSVATERVFPDPTGPSASTCTGCHTVSRDGKRLAAGYDKNVLAEFSLPDRSTILDVGNLGIEPAAEDAPTPMPKAGMPPPMVWSTFSPDGTRLLVAGGGELRLVDADTGALIGPVEASAPMPMGTRATHPDWSPLGDRVVVVLASKGGDKQTEGGSIAVLPYADDALGTPEVLVTAVDDKDNNYFPSFSPDARFIAYVNATGGSQEAVSASLRLYEVATGKVSVLTRLNQRVRNEDDILDVGNTMPTWAPSTADGTYWLAFSSLRAYADVRPQDPKQDQIWIAAVDPRLDDPGFAAFWAPFQHIDQGSHRAFWTPAETGATCSCVERCADGVDNDCDGAVDEDDCIACAVREICDDGIDNDCDCVTDDCSIEVCDDKLDNDGDGKSDGMDAACPKK